MVVLGNFITTKVIKNHMNLTAKEQRNDSPKGFEIIFWEAKNI